MYSKIFQLAIPSILTNITIPLLSTVDILLIGKNSAQLLGSIGLGITSFNILIWNFTFLKMGITGLTSQALGRNDDREIIHLLVRFLLISITLTCLILLFKNQIRELIFSFLSVSETHKELVQSYFDLRILGVPASVASLCLFGWFIGLQNVSFPLLNVTLTNLLNIGLSYYLVTYQSYGIKGVALGTVIAQYFSLFISIYYIYRKYPTYLRLFEVKEVRSIKKYQETFSVNKYLFMRGLTLTIVLNYFVSIASSIGATVLALYTILSQVINWISYALDGFATACEALVGKSVGSRDLGEFYEVIKKSFLVSVLVSFIMSLFISLLFSYLLSFVTKDPLVLKLALEHKYWFVLFPILGFSSYIWDGVYIGMTASYSMMMTMILSCLVCLVTYFILSDSLNFHFICFIQASFMISRGLFQTYYFFFKRSGFKLF